MHHFRAARRRAAIERRNLEVGELRAALQKLKSEPVVSEREVFVGVEKEETQIEKTVEVPVEKGAEKETTAEKLEDEVAATGGGFTEADISAAFAKGTEMAMAAKDDLEKSLLEKSELMVWDYESKLRKMEEREKKMKDMLKQALEKHETKIIEVPVDRIVEKTIDFNDLPKAGKDTFLAFLKAATSDKKSREYTELYMFLFNNFMLADKEAKGAVTAEQFNYLAEISACAWARAQVLRVADRAPGIAHAALRGHGQGWWWHHHLRRIPGLHDYF